MAHAFSYTTSRPIAIILIESHIEDPYFSSKFLHELPQYNAMEIAEHKKLSFYR